MGFQEFVTVKLAAITERLNAMSEKAKKIDELTPQLSLDPDSRIHVSKAGKSERIEVRQIIEAIENNTYDEIVSIGSPVIVFNATDNKTEVVVPSNPIPQWRINNIYYSKNSITKKEVPFAYLGFNRIDILLMTTTNDIIIERGVESAGIAVRPPKPINTIILSEIYVTDNTVGDPSLPIDLSNKLEKGGYVGTAQTLKNEIEASKSGSIDFKRLTANTQDFEMPAGKIAIWALVNFGIWVKATNNNADEENTFTQFGSTVRFKTPREINEYIVIFY